MSFKTPKGINHRGDKQMAQFYSSQWRLFALASLFLRSHTALVPLVGSMPLGLWKQMNRLRPTSPSTHQHFRTPKLGHAASLRSDPHRIRGDGLMNEFPKRQSNLWHHSSGCTPTPGLRLASPPWKKNVPVFGDNAISITKMSLGCIANPLTYLSFLTSVF
jgi:hypothetical protein